MTTIRMQIIQVNRSNMLHVQIYQISNDHNPLLILKYIVGTEL